MRKLGLVALLMVALASPAMAGQIQVGYPGSSYGPYQTDRGGEFTLNVLSGWLSTSSYVMSTSGFGAATTFQTFCLEIGEFLYPYGPTYNAVVNPNAVYGGVGPGGDPISKGTGWLYSQFALGTLAYYNYGDTSNGYFSDRHAAAAALQNTIWWLEGEAGDPGGTNRFRNLVLGLPFNPFADGGVDYGVYALNLTDNSGRRYQDQLFYRGVPDGGMTLMLLGGALIGLGALHRKFRA